MSSVVAASAYAGIPMTHRDLSSSVTFITGSDREGRAWSPDAWHRLATATDTICVLMGMQRIDAITRALDRGAGGVQIPHVNTRAEAEAVVRHAKFAPIGHRGFAGGRAAFGESMHDFTRRANEETMVVVMLEELEALHNLDDILKTQHVDVFFVAPGDLAQSMGHPGQMDHPAVQAAIDDAVKRIRAAGRAPGVLSTPATVRRYLDLGALFLYVGLAAVLVPGSKDFLGAFPRS